VVVRLQSSLDLIERRQMAALSSVEDSMESRVRQMRGVFTDLGLDIPRLEAATPRAGVGGPFVPVKLAADAGAFERQLYRINITRTQVERLNRTLALVPYRKPVVGEVEFTSGFGVRSDPFLGRPAMHTGLDFRAATGDPVRATANGKVVSSGWAGGYGRMIEIDHGNGLSTRYGHLSEIAVKIGDQIKIGQVIGAVGSTGRSTVRICTTKPGSTATRSIPRNPARRRAAECRLKRLWAVYRKAWTQNRENNPMQSRMGPPARSTRAARRPGTRRKMVRRHGPHLISSRSSARPRRQ